MVDAPYFPAERDEPAGAVRRPAVGYAMVLVAATLFAVNGTVSKVLLESGLSSLRLTQVRATGAFLGLALAIALVRPRSLAVRPRELPFLAVFGVLGIAFVQLFYFLAIRRLPIGIALLIEYLAPLLIALWARFVVHDQVRRRLWVALGLALAGLAVIVQLWSGVALNGLGVAFALIDAVAYATYILLAEHKVGDRDPLSLSCYGFGFAALFWTIVEPWSGFPGRHLGAAVELQGRLAESHLPLWLLVGWMVVLGTIVPFALVVASLRHITATRAGIVAMLEPVAASAVAFAWLGESLGTTQLVGGAVVLVAIGLAQTAR